MCALIFSLLISSNLYASDISTIEVKVKRLQKEQDSGVADIFFSLSKEFQAVSRKFHKSVEKDISNNTNLTGDQLTSLHRLVSSYITLSYQIFKKSESTHNLETKTLLRFEILRLAGNTYLPLFFKKKLRLLLNAEDMAFNISKEELRKHLLVILSSSEIDKNKALLEKLKKVLPEYDYRKIDNHIVTKKLNVHRYFSNLRRIIERTKFSDFGARSTQFLVHHLSGAFGNSAGAIKWRKGYLYNNEKIIKELRDNLKPLDIITEKAGFALTDTFIPGHFGHNAIWLGGKDELIKLGLWDNLIPDHIKKGIEEGKQIIETDRSGTHLKSLEDFMNVDDFAILRLGDKTLGKKLFENVYKVAFSQLGKTYDFNFDVETTDKLVCSELLYQSFGMINWPTRKYLGRTTISPDNIGSLLFYEDSPLELVQYFSGSPQGYISKTFDDLASDIGLLKKGEKFFEKIETCKVRKIKKPGPRRRGSRSSDFINVKSCKKNLRNLRYTEREIVH